MSAVVSDASVLICLGAVGQLNLLRDFYRTVAIPESVWQEVTGADPSLPGSAETVEARQLGWLSVQKPGNQALVTSLRTTLHVGEAEAIALASELGAGLLLIDETEGRVAARALGLTVTGTVGVLIRAKQSAKLPRLKPILTELVQRQNFRLSNTLFEQVLRQVGEDP